MKVTGKMRKIALACCENSLRTEASEAMRGCLPMKLAEVGVVQVVDGTVAPWIEFEGGLIYCPFREPTPEEISVGAGA